MRRTHLRVLGRSWRTAPLTVTNRLVGVIFNVVNKHTHVTCQRRNVRERRRCDDESERLRCEKIIIEHQECKGSACPLGGGGCEFTVTVQSINHK